MLITKLDYTSGSTALEKGQFGISPSSINDFIATPHKWYREKVLGEEGFTGSTASVLGTIVHFIAESYATTQTVDKEEIYKYLIQQTHVEQEYPLDLFERTEDEVHEYLTDNARNPNIDCRHILKQYKDMGNALIQYIRRTGIPARSEELIKAEVTPGYWACGSADACTTIIPAEGRYMTPGVLIDYKTTSDKTPKAYIPMNYKYQLLTYAWIYRQNGIPINSIRIVWVTQPELNRIGTTGKALKDYPAQAVAVTELITDADMDFIESILKLISETVQASVDYPHLTHCLFKDYRLKKD